jgi:hypothetical protein
MSSAIYKRQEMSSTPPESGTLNESYVLVDHYDGDILPVMTKVCK